MILNPKVKRMGKNQAYKAMQRARLGSGSGGPDEVDDGMVRPFSHYSLIINTI